MTNKRNSWQFLQRVCLGATSLSARVRQTKPTRPDTARPPRAAQSTMVRVETRAGDRREEPSVTGSTARLPASPHSPVQHTRLAAVTP